MKYCSLITKIIIILFMLLTLLTDPINSSRGKQIYIDTVKLYSTLNFEDIRSTPLWIWNEYMEFRYWVKLMTWNVKPLKVIIVPFSHNDAGWLRTYEEYCETKTKRILDNLVSILPDLEDMTFVWSEICFLQYWWDRTSEDSRNTFKDLVNIGKVEIVTGGWVMPDEATTHVFSLHNQLVEGHQWIWENLEIRPENAWSIDPFGCSSVMAYLLACSGIEALVVQRVHYSWKRFFSEEGMLDVLWEQDFDAPVMKLRIQPGPGYTTTDSCGPATVFCPQYDFNDEISVAEHVTFGNIRKKAEIILGQYGRLGSLSTNNAALITLGGDFRFENKSEWFQQYRNYKALMDYINSDKSFSAEIHFGTLKNFFNQIKCLNVTLQGDFFPYADLGAENQLAYWTGFYSTRPYWKKLSRSLESMLRSTEILYTLAFNAISKETLRSKPHKVLIKQFKKLIRARRTTALFQHHDGITGTSRARVMSDYKSKMLNSLHELKITQTLCMEIMLCGDKNISTIDDKLLKKILVFNNLPHYRSEAIIIKTDHPCLLVRDSKKAKIQSQIKSIFTSSELIGNTEMSDEVYELTFIDFLPPFSINAYEILSKDIANDRNNFIYWNGSVDNVEGLSVENGHQKINFGKNGLLKSIMKDFGSISMKSSLKAYNSELGSSGAYLFKPKREEINVFSDIVDGDVVFIDGSVYKENKVTFRKDYSISTRLYETDLDLGEIIEMKITYNLSEVNKELFLEFVTDLKETKFYTDINSFEIRERVRNTHQEVEGNYYPITSLAYLENTNFTFAIITDHSHGAASSEDGSIEIMLDRRMFADDQRGLDESLDEAIQTTSTFFLVFLKALPASKELLYKLAVQLNNPAPIVVTTNGTPSKSLTFINQPLPSNIEILNFRTLSQYGHPSSTALLTLRNLGSRNNSDTFSKDTKFNYIDIKTMLKTSLTGLKDGDELDELHDIKVKMFNILSLKVFF